MAVNSRPVVGGLVGGEPTEEVAANSIVSTVTLEEHAEPATLTPERHSARITGVPTNTVPVRETPAGFKILWSARRIMSKPVSPADELITTATLSWWTGSAFVELSNGGVAGQLPAPPVAIQTIPTPLESE